MTARLKSSILRPFALALLSPLLLVGCVVTPGKFVSTLKVGADRSFAFTYVGEVYAIDLEGMGKGLGSLTSETAAASDDTDVKDAAKETDKADPAAEAAAKQAEQDKKNEGVAEALRKESGYRRVEYLGKGKFSIDYAIAGRLTHGFVYPYNVDAEIIVPFIAIELRGKDVVRIKAPAFAAGATKGAGMPGMDGSSDKLDGTFTLTTDAEIVSQNNEAGAVAGPGGKTISWKATPLTKDAPLAVLRVAGI